MWLLTFWFWVVASDSTTITVPMFSATSWRTIGQCMDAAAQIESEFKHQHDASTDAKGTVTLGQFTPKCHHVGNPGDNRP